MQLYHTTTPIAYYCLLYVSLSTLVKVTTFFCYESTSSVIVRQWFSVEHNWDKNEFGFPLWQWSFLGSGVTELMTRVLDFNGADQCQPSVWGKSLIHNCQGNCRVQLVQSSTDSCTHHPTFSDHHCDYFSCQEMATVCLSVEVEPGRPSQSAVIKVHTRSCLPDVTDSSRCW